MNRLVDGAVAGLVGALGLAEIWVPFPSVMGEGSRALTSAVVFGLAGLLAFRRRWPLPIAVGVLAVWPLVFAISPVLVLFFGQFVPMTMAVFSVARHGRGREPWFGAAAAAAALLFMDLRVEVLQDPGEIAFHWGVFLIAFTFGAGLRRSEQRAVDSTRRAVEAELSVRASALAAVADERARIARELHDVVAHALSVMVVQAGAAEQVVDDDSAYVRAALGRIRLTGTNTLAEMRRLVTMLREDDAPGALAPQPSIAEIGALIDEARRSGLDVTLAVAGEPRPLPAGLDLAAYRIVQEALTNVRRHAGASRADVQLTYQSATLEIEVTDDGRGVAATQGEVGHGLIGMKERAGLYGGTVLAAPRREGGFVVRASLPAST